MERKKEALRIITSVVKDAPTAEMVLERLQDEGFLHLGYGDAAVDQITGAFKEEFGSIKTTKYDRMSAHRLATAHTPQAVVGVIKLLAKVRDEKYAPTVGSVQQLEDKWVNVLSFIRKRHQQSEIVDV
jgi:hypothetical protein